MHSSPPPLVYLIGDMLPDVKCFDLVSALDYLGNSLAPLFNPVNEIDKRKSALNTLDFFISENFCQGFLVTKFKSEYLDYEIVHALPFKNDDGEKYVITLDLENGLVHSKGYSGELRIPVEGLHYGTRFFIDKFLVSSDRDSFKTAAGKRLSGYIPVTDLQKRHAYIHQLIEEIISICDTQRIPFNKQKMPGTRIDFTDLLRRLHKDFKSYSDSTINDYYSACDLKFGRGTRPGKSAFWKTLFPDCYR